MEELRRLRVWSRRPTTRVAGVLQIAAILLLVVYMVVENPDVRAWLPNVATAVAALGWTIVIVEQIVQREAAQRVWPRVESVMNDLRYRLQSFAQSVVVDYSGTHLRTFRPVPADLIAFLDQWLEDVDTHDACSILSGDDERPPVRSLVIWAGVELGNELRRIREQDREVIEPAIVRAIDDYLWLGVQHGTLMQTLTWPDRPPEDHAQGFRLGEQILVERAKHLIDVFVQHDGGERLSFPDLTISAAAEHNRGVQDRDWYYEHLRHVIRASRYRDSHDVS